MKIVQESYSTILSEKVALRLSYEILKDRVRFSYDLV